MSHDDHAVELTEARRPRRRQNITALTTLPQVWVSARKHQYSDHYDVDWIFVGLSWKLHCRWQLDRALERWRTRRDKRARNSTTKVCFCIIIIRLCHCKIAIAEVLSESCELWGYLFTLFTLRGTIFPLPGV